MSSPTCGRACKRQARALKRRVTGSPIHEVGRACLPPLPAAARQSVSHSNSKRVTHAWRWRGRIDSGRTGPAGPGATGRGAVLPQEPRTSRQRPVIGCHEAADHGRPGEGAISLSLGLGILPQDGALAGPEGSGRGTGTSPLLLREPDQQTDSLIGCCWGGGPRPPW